MILKIFNDGASLAQTAAEQAAAAIGRAISERGLCRLVLATGNAQLAFLDALTRKNTIDWSKVEAFHLDEYVGLATTHPASFRKFLLERIINKVGIGKHHLLEGDAEDLPAAIGKVTMEIASAPIDVAFVGIGENGHIAFNDPPADFTTEVPYIVVELDEPCRRQQVGEGWFANLSDVPTHAISMSARQVIKAREIVAIVPDLRKAHAVKLCLEGEVRPMAPASILRKHPNTTVYLDDDSASLLSPAVRNADRI